MNTQRDVSTLAGILFIVISIIVFFGGVFSYEHFAIQRLNSILQTQSNLQNKVPVIVIN